MAQLENAVHVVTVLDYGELPDGEPYNVMPYLPHSLSDELGKDVFDVKALADLPGAQRPRAMPLERVLAISEQPLKGLAAAHGKGLVHRDIKPANIMLTEESDVRIVDFGIAKAPDGQHPTVSHLGMVSRNCMAREQRESAKHVDARAGVYAVGRVIYRMLTGKLPVGRFADPNVAVPALGKAMNDAILAEISEDGEERSADASALLARLQQAKTSVGQEDTSEHSVTWAGEQGESGICDELKPLKAAITAQVVATGFIPAAEMKAVRAMALVADLDDTGLTRLIADTLGQDKAPAALGQLIRQEVGEAGQALDAQALSVYQRAADTAGWSGEQLHAVMQAAVADLSKPEVAASSSLRPSSPKHDAKPSQGGESAGAASSADARSTSGSPKQANAIASKPRSKLPAVLAALLVLSGAGYGVYEWRQKQIAAEQREEQVRLAQLSETQREQERIRSIQRDLNALGYRVEESGVADTRTVEAIKTFERAQKLVVSGAADGLLATALKEELVRRDDAAWAAATKEDTDVAYAEYRSKHPNGRHVADVERRIVAAKQKESSRMEAARLAEEKCKADEARQAEDMAWAAATTQDSEAAYEAYRSRYPAGRHASELPQRILAAKEKARIAAEREAQARNGGFEDLGGGRLRDTQTGLVWTQSDNARDINWDDANAYCQGKGLRLPSIEELAAIYNRPGAGTTSCGGSACRVPPIFRLTSFWIWSGSRESSKSAFRIGLLDGHRNAYPNAGTRLYRALCVGR